MALVLLSLGSANIVSDADLLWPSPLWAELGCVVDFGRCARAGVARVLCVLTRTRHEWTIMISGTYIYMSSAPCILSRQRWTIAVSGAAALHASGGPLRFQVYPFTPAVDHFGFMCILSRQRWTIAVSGTYVFSALYPFTSRARQRATHPPVRCSLVASYGRNCSPQL